jgi:hypothetical protein
LEPFKVLFDKGGNPIKPQTIKRQAADYPEAYRRVVEFIIPNSIVLNREIFRVNVARLMPSFGMTRRGAFHGLKIVNKNIIDPNGVLDTCWEQTSSELQDLKKHVNRIASSLRSRTILELPQEPRNHIVEKASSIFEKLKWISVKSSNVYRVGASKILFAVFPEIALPVDNAEWDYVFRTDSYGKVLQTMVEEVEAWEGSFDTPIEKLGAEPTTIPSVYNIMAMAARPPKKHH